MAFGAEGLCFLFDFRILGKGAKAFILVAVGRLVVRYVCREICIDLIGAAFENTNLKT